ncbi:MAG: hypothetical protein ABSD42_14875 [Candidatus Bathyarchaeia archaeon]|jgi:hypothetical protein
MISLKSPCKVLKYCPYGYLVEQFPLGDMLGDNSTFKKNKNAKACFIFGHDCPCWYVAESIESYNDGINKFPKGTTIKRIQRLNK